VLRSSWRASAPLLGPGVLFSVGPMVGRCSLLPPPSWPSKTGSLCSAGGCAGDDGEQDGTDGGTSGRLRCGGAGGEGAEPENAADMQAGVCNRAP
jgi:hypothetical protein